MLLWIGASFKQPTKDKQTSERSRARASGGIAWCNGNVQMRFKKEKKPERRGRNEADSGIGTNTRKKIFEKKRTVDHQRIRIAFIRKWNRFFAENCRCRSRISHRYVYDFIVPSSFGLAAAPPIKFQVIHRRFIDDGMAFSLQRCSFLRFYSVRKAGHR